MTDLGRINRDRDYVVPRCAGFVDRLACPALNQERAQPKPRAIRTARKHASDSGHTVVLYISHWQLVRPTKAAEA